MHINKEKIKIYFYLIPFLHPRGLYVFPFMKIFFIGWMCIVLILILFEFMIFVTRKKKWNQSFVFHILIYYIPLFLITLLVRFTFEDALQKVFAAPVLCLLCAMYMEKQPEKFIKATNNIFIIIFFLANTIFSPYVQSDLYNAAVEHYTFLGHVQIASQLGVVSLFFCYVEYYYWSQKKKFKSMIQLALTVITMALSYTSASYIALILLVIFYIINQTSFNKIFEYSSRTYVTIFFLFNILVFLFVTQISPSLNLGIFSLNGRGFIWIEAIESFLKSPIYGYGVHGTYIKVFWSVWNDNQGMNYMHNQILQVLNDGGIILLIPFVIMLYYIVNNAVYVPKGRLRFWTMAVIMSILVIMTFESTLEYFYMWFILALIAYLPRIDTVNRPSKVKTSRLSGVL